jgi:hypothetical protein
MYLTAWLVTAILPTLVSQLAGDEVVVFYPTCAHLSDDGRNWTIPVHGVVYEPERDSLRRSLAVALMRRAVAVEDGTPEAAIFDRRVGLFLVDHERGKEISIRLGTGEHPIGRSRASGHFFGELQLPVGDAARLLRGRQTPGNWISFQAVTRENDHRRFVGRAQLIESRGLSVISDIDDTIKDSQVGDRKALLQNTFVRDFRPVPGMAELYRGWARQGVVFHYVSGSPWQLYLPLSEFLEKEGFPAGSMHLKQFRLKDPTAFSLLASQEETKLGAIEPILTAFPHRRFVLVGDSGEQDPEIYGKIARKYGQQIAAILIRNVTGEAAQGERLRRALEGIEPRRWQLFRWPEQLREVPHRLSQPQEAAG